MIDSDDTLVKAHRLCADGQTRAAMKLCLPKAEAGDIACARLLGWIYTTGGGEIQRNPVEAKHWLKQALEGGDPLATYLLGIVVLEEGDTEAAIEYFRQAGSDGVSAGLYQLGKLYELGGEVKRNEERAYDYYRASASMGHVFARRRVAGMLLAGHRGVFGRVVGFPMLLAALVLGIYTVVTDPYGEKVYE